MHRHFAAIIGASLLTINVLLGAQAPGERGAPPSNANDENFARESAIAGMAEVELGKMAAQKGKAGKVKSFGQQMVTDHTKAGDELKRIATAKGITLPTAIDPMHQATRDKLAKLSGAEFDRAYVEAMVMGHQTVAKNMMNEANSGTDAELKAFATKAIPTVQMHLKMAEEIEHEVGGRTK